MNQHILVLEENREGRDFIIGDVHGCYEQLNLVLARMTLRDRVFIAGDLFDRGPGSHQVFCAIMNDNAARKKAGLNPRIYLPRGNHEEIFLDFYKKRNEPEHRDHKFYIQKDVGGEWALKLAESELTRINDFISSLPYIIHVRGSKPFNMVHADMPFDDIELMKRINSLDPRDRQLTKLEIEYAIYTRNNEFEDFGRSKNSIITFCGHNIAGGVRKDTNHVNLDLGTFSNGILCLTNYTEGYCELIGNTNLQQKIIRNNKSALGVQQEVNAQLKYDHKQIISWKISSVNENENLDDLNKIERIKTILYEFPNLPLRALALEHRIKFDGYNLEAYNSVCLHNYSNKTSQVDQMFLALSKKRKEPEQDLLEKTNSQQGNKLQRKS